MSSTAQALAQSYLLKRSFESFARVLTSSIAMEDRSAKLLSIRAEIQRLIAEKNAAYNAYCADKERFKELQTIQHNLAELHSEPTLEKTKKKEQEL